MNAQEIQDWITSTKAAIDIVKEMLTLIPPSEKKDEALARIHDVEVELAVKQGLETCKRHFPVGIMTIQGDTFRCLKCGLSDSDGLRSPVAVKTHLSKQSR